MRHWVVLVAVALGACGSDQGPEPVLESVQIEPNEHNVVSAVAVVTATGFDSAFVRFWREGTSRVSEGTTARW